MDCKCYPSVFETLLISNPIGQYKQFFIFANPKPLYLVLIYYNSDSKQLETTKSNSINIWIAVSNSILWHLKLVSGITGDHHWSLNGTQMNGFQKWVLEKK